MPVGDPGGAEARRNGWAQLGGHVLEVEGHSEERRSRSEYSP
jgi:hypothetical protein